MYVCMPRWVVVICFKILQPLPPQITFSSIENVRHHAVLPRPLCCVNDTAHLHFSVCYCVFFFVSADTLVVCCYCLLLLLLPFSFIVGYNRKLRRKMLIFVAVIAWQTQFAVTVLCALEESFDHAEGTTLSQHAHIQTYYFFCIAILAFFLF